MNILVTGGAGYIGSVVVEQLVNQGHQPIVVDDMREGNRGAVHPEAVLYPQNFGHCSPLATIFETHSIDAVMHFAADATVEFSMTDPERYFINNVVNSITLLKTMRKYNCTRFIFSSTAATFGEPQYTPIDESHPQKPINAYGASKLMFEGILDWYNQAYGLRFNAFRYFNAAGASAKFGESHRRESHLIPLVIEVALGKREHINIYGTDYPTKDGTCVRDYVHVLDLAQAHILALENLDQQSRGKYNLGNGEGFSVLEVLEMVEKISGSKISHVMAERRVGDPAILIAASELAKYELGWNPQFSSLEAIVRSAWQWHERHPNGYENYRP